MIVEIEIAINFLEMFRDNYDLTIREYLKVENILNKLRRLANEKDINNS